MKASNKTKTQLISELEALQERVSELEKDERDSRQAQRDLGAGMGRYFSKVEHVDEAIYVLFDRKYEFINEKFSELFGITPEEACSDKFDMMTLVAPESRDYIRGKYRESLRSEFMVQHYEFTGMTKDGLKIDCETFVLFIPYKWGVAIHGMLRDISMRRRIDEELQRHSTDLQIVLNSIPTSIFYTDRNHRFIMVNPLDSHLKRLSESHLRNYLKIYRRSSFLISLKSVIKS
jgi:PAS domain S-box-containing protein